MGATSGVTQALDHFAKNRTKYLDDLKKLVRIPSISFPGFDPKEVHRCADAVASQMREIGLENVEVIEFDGGFPYVYADWLHAPGKPTVLLYAHYDVQPIGDEKKWHSPAFEPTERDGRMFARGAADDKAGISVHLAAISSYLRTVGKLPLNVKLIIEGEEEIGSGSLGAFVKKYKEKLRSDAMILTDTENFDVGIPSLTVSLRGLVVLAMEVQALGHSVHSGLQGGPLPDPAMGLVKILSTLTDEHGHLAIPGTLNDIRKVTPAEKKDFEALPFDEHQFRSRSGLLPEVPLRAGLDGKVNVYQQIWREPSVAINAIEVSSRQQANNSIPASAWARLGIRIVPDMNGEKILNQLMEHIRSVTPWGLKVTLHPDSAAGGWGTVPEGKAFDAAKKALELGYGRKPVMMGSGGTIPFVEPLASQMGGIPALLMGVEDPFTNAHSENESLHLGDWEKAIRSAIQFYSIYAE